MLDAKQTIILGVMATILSQLIIIQIAQRKGVKVGKAWATVIVLMVSLLLAYAWSGVKLMMTSQDSADMLTQLISSSGQVIGFATVIYNVILTKVFSLLNWDQENSLPIPSTPALQPTAPGETPTPKGT